MLGKNSKLFTYIYWEDKNMWKAMQILLCGKLLFNRPWCLCIQLSHSNMQWAIWGPSFLLLHKERSRKMIMDMLCKETQASKGETSQDSDSGNFQQFTI